MLLPLFQLGIFHLRIKAFGGMPSRHSRHVMFRAGMLWLDSFTLSPLISGYIPIMLPTQRNRYPSFLLRCDRCHSHSHRGVTKRMPPFATGIGDMWHGSSNERLWWRLCFEATQSSSIRFWIRELTNRSRRWGYLSLAYGLVFDHILVCSGVMSVAFDGPAKQDVLWLSFKSDFGSLFL